MGEIAKWKKERNERNKENPTVRGGFLNSLIF